MRRCVINLHATAFKGDDLERTWAPYAERVLYYGAKSYSFIRSDDDPLHFIHLSDWVDPEQFELYWYSPEMDEARERASGMFQVPLVPHWAKLVSTGSR